MFKKITPITLKQTYWHCDCGKVRVEGPQKITVIAIRHGESQHNIAGVVNGDPKKDFHLTPKGQLQAKEVAQKLRHKKIVAIISSEMPRTRESAAYLSDLNKIPVQVDKRLNDINAGGLEGVPILEFRKTTQNTKISVEGSETNTEMGKRIKSFLEELIGCYAGQVVAIVSSEIVLHALRQVSQGLPCDEDSGEHVQNGVAYEFIIRSPICCPSCGDSCKI